MSKYKAKTYAEALANLDVKADEKKVVNNFLRLLERNGDMKKAPEIITQTEKLLLKKSGNKKVVLQLARKAADKDIKGEFAKKGDIVQEKINPSLIAGIKVIVDGNKQLDLSLLHKLNNIF